MKLPQRTLMRTDGPVETSKIPGMAWRARRMYDSLGKPPGKPILCTDFLISPSISTRRLLKDFKDRLKKKKPYITSSKTFSIFPLSGQQLCPQNYLSILAPAA
jgi:hypothetical protein